MTTDGGPRADVAIDADLVRGLLADQRPDVAGLRLAPVASGWDNAAWRLGDDLAVRLPRRELNATHAIHEARLLPRISARVPLAVPLPVHRGAPGRGYPWPWLIVRWIPGADAVTTPPSSTVDAADRLADFLTALWAVDPEGAPANPWRGGALVERDELVRRRLAEVGDRLGVAPSRLRDVWEAALAAPRHPGPPVLIHGDLHPANLVVADGRLVGVLDFGDLTAGDPATDLIVAWSLLDHAGRARLQRQLELDEATWLRGAGWALSVALAIVEAGHRRLAPMAKQALGQLAAITSMPPM